VRSTVAGNFQFDGIHFFAPRTILAGGLGGTGWVFSGQSRNLTNENTLTYRGTLGPGSMDVLGGFSVQRFASEAIRGDGANFPIDATGVYNLGSGSQLIAPSSDASESAIISYLGRANYNIAGKYLFTLTGRRDGSSVFGANHKWAFFPSGAFAWRLSDEDFMRRQSLVSDLKLRLSYGKVGSQAVGPYQSLSRLVIAWYSAGTTEIPAMAPSGTMPNPDLRWEQQSQFNAGLDAGLWNNRITLSFDAYRSTTKDLLLSVAVPSTTGFSSQLRNIGSVRNSGVELALTTVNVQGPRLTWRTTLSVAHNKNRVLDLGTTLDSKGNTVPLRQINVTPRTGGFFSPGDLYIIRVGQPLSAIYGYRVTGLWQPGDPCYLKNPAQNCVPGEYKIADIPDSLGVVDSVIDAKDRVILGSGDPKFYGGFGNSVTFGPFSLDAFFSFVYGNKIINAGNAYGCLGIMQANERTCTLDRWTPQHTNTTVPRLNNARPRSLYSTLVEDGSYLRLQTLTFGFQLPAALLPAGASSARLFITGQNLWTTTKYTGFDPDVNSMGGDPRFAGIDIGAYPRSRVWNFGLNLGF
jgi:TonB-linked SusC/RagA family outer membrane protein